MKEPHVSVLLPEVLEVFKGKKLGCFFDATLGAGGHAEALLKEHPEIEVYIGCDRDTEALALAQKRLAEWKDKLFLVHGNHSDVKHWVQKAKRDCTDGHLIDAGVSSMQLDRPEKGFSFQTEGPLDMRMNSEGEKTAKELVNRLREEELEKILREFGEEPRARAIARAIVTARKKKKLETTTDLVDAIRPVARGKKHLHFATLTFQAIRIAVNDELDELKRGIEEGIETLCSGGRIAVISFHRLEDRIAKNCFREQEIKKKDLTGQLTLLSKKPIGPSEKEIKNNPRSRSAKLRAAEKK